MDKVILDTNIMLSGLRSNKGFSFKLLQVLPNDFFQLQLSVPLVIEYEAVLMKMKSEIGLSESEIIDFIDYICKVSSKVDIYYLWKPLLKDPFDDHILEVAVASQSGFIITFNKKDFELAKRFGIEVLTPKEYCQLRRII